MKGIVTSIKRATNPSENMYFLLGEGVLTTKSDLLLDLFDKVDISDGKAVILGNAGTEEYHYAVKKLAVKAQKAHKSRVNELNPVTARINETLESAVNLLIERCISGTPVIIRFHNDCDGSSGAVALFDALGKLSSSLGVDTFNVAWRMNKSIAYTIDSFHSDSSFFNSFSSIEKPLVMVTDFGTSQESEEAIGLGIERNDFIWLDHHPIYSGFPKGRLTYYVNPWDFGGDSDYTAGFLTCVFAEMISGLGFDGLKEASLLGDYSKYADKNNKNAHKLAIVLDYLTSKKSIDSNVTPKQIKSIIDDAQKLDETFAHASSLLNDAIEQGVNRAKKYTTKNGVKIFVLQFGSVTRENEDYPIMGRYSTWLQNRLEGIEGEKVVTFVYHGNYISVRAHRKVVEMLNLTKTLEQLKNASEHIYSYGGHEAAFSIKINKERQEQVISMIMSELGATQGA